MIVLYDLGASFWRNCHGGNRDPGLAYEDTIENIRHYSQEFDHLAICCDGPNCKRYTLYPEYKASRKLKPRPPEAYEALADIERESDKYGSVLKCEGYEGDDVIASLVAQSWDIEEEIAIVGIDKDLFALIGNGVFVWSNKGRQDAEQCREKFGVEPTQMRDLLALAGDSSDDVPGCPGVGMGKAAGLIAHFGSLNAIMAAAMETPIAKKNRLTEIAGIGKTVVDNLRNWDPTLAISLVTLMTDAPVSIDRVLAHASAA